MYSISLSITARFNLKEGIPYLNTPPGSERDSKILTLYFFLAKSAAQVNPAGPEPTTAIFMSVDCLMDRGAELFL